MLRSLIEDEGRAAMSAAVLGIIGFLDIPLIHMSVYWWRTLHQPPSILRPDKAPWENVHPAMLTALVNQLYRFFVALFLFALIAIRLGRDARANQSAAGWNRRVDGGLGDLLVWPMELFGAQSSLYWFMFEAALSGCSNGTRSASSLGRRHRQCQNLNVF